MHGHVGDAPRGFLLDAVVRKARGEKGDQGFGERGAKTGAERVRIEMRGVDREELA